MKTKLLLYWFFGTCLLLMNPIRSQAQIEFYRESFVDFTNITSPQGFCGNDNSGGCSTSANIWNIDSCTSFTGSGGPNLGFFWGQDVDACGSTTNPHEVTVCMAVPLDKPGEITFEGMFGAWCCFSAFDANDSVRIAISTDGGSTYSNELLIRKRSGADQLEITDGTTTNPLTTAFTQMSVSLGSGHAGETICVKATYYNLISGSEGVAMDEFVLLHTAPPCSITDLAAGSQTGCVKSSNAYTQEVTVTFTDPPATGTLVVNGQNFAIGTSPQTVTLTGLNSDGNAVDVTANFSANTGCSRMESSLFTAPAFCGCTTNAGTISK